MSQDASARIRNNPKFTELVAKRSAFAWTLTAVMLTIYFGFILIVAYAPGFLGTPLYAGSVATIGFPLGVLVILSAIGLTGIYVAKANSEFDQLTRQIVEEAK